MLVAQKATSVYLHEMKMNSHRMNLNQIALVIGVYFVQCHRVSLAIAACPDRWGHSQHLVLNTNLPAAGQQWHTLLLPFSSILDMLIIAHSFQSICNKLCKKAPAWEIWWLSGSLVGNTCLTGNEVLGKKKPHNARRWTDDLVYFHIQWSRSILCVYSHLRLQWSVDHFCLLLIVETQ